MTETQIDHRAPLAPLAPGEIRTYVVGNRAFRVMHVAGGSFTQASFREGVDGPSVVLATDRFADVAVRAYAEAIEQAESDAIDALDDADGPSFDASGAYLDGESKSLVELLNEYGAAMARAGMRLVNANGSVETAAPYAARADALKVEILARFGGER